MSIFDDIKSLKMKEIRKCTFSASCQGLIPGEGFFFGSNQLLKALSSGWKTSLFVFSGFADVKLPGILPLSRQTPGLACIPDDRFMPDIGWGDGMPRGLIERGV